MAYSVDEGEVGSVRRLSECGILSDEIALDVAQAMEWIAGMGLGYVELRSLWGTNVVDWSAEQIDRVQGLIVRHALKVSGIASPVFKCALDPGHPPAVQGDRFGTEEASIASHFRWLEKALALAKRFEATRVRIFSFWREAAPQDHFPEVVAHLREAGRLAEAYGIPLVLENEPACNGGSADEVFELVTAVDSPMVGMLWDPGNDYYGGFRVDPDQAQYLLGKAAHVHLKDAVDHGGVRTIVPLGQGGVDWRSILAALDGSGYRGHLILEPHVANGILGVEASVAGLKTLLAAGPS